VFEIVYHSGSARRRTFHVAGTDCVVGRSRHVDLSIENRAMAKKHAQFTQKEGGIFVRDLGSSVGTYVNRQRIVEYGPLDTLDEVIVGGVKIELQKIVSPKFYGAGQNTMPVSENGNSTFRPDLGQASATTADESFQSQGAELLPPTATDTTHAIKSDIKQLAYWGQVVHERLLDTLDLRRKDVSRMSDAQLRAESDALIGEIVSDLSAEIPNDVAIDELRQHVLNESVGLGPLESFLADDAISEVMVNNHQEIFIERFGRLEKSPLQFSSDKTVYSVIERIITPLGRRIDESSPIVDARLKDGSRVNAVIPPLSLKGPSLTIRKFPKHRLSFATLIQSGSISESMVEFLKICVEQRRNIVVSGGTGSGKTTLLNLLSSFIPADQRIVTIEDAAELKLEQPNLVSLESRPANSEGNGMISIRDLMKNSLRMRPDRIVVGECRGGEAIDMLQAMNTGHNGSLTTIHANTPRDVVSRLEVLTLMGGMEIPISALREQIASAVDIIIQQNRMSCGARMVTQITEVVGVESGTIQLQEIFRFQSQGVNASGKSTGAFTPSGFIPTFYEPLREQGLPIPIDMFSPAEESVRIDS